MKKYWQHTWVVHLLSGFSTFTKNFWVINFLHQIKKGYHSLIKSFITYKKERIGKKLRLKRNTFLWQQHLLAKKLKFWVGGRKFDLHTFLQTNICWCSITLPELQDINLSPAAIYIEELIQETINNLIS